MEHIVNIIGGKTPIGIIIDFYLIWILVVFLFKFAFKSRKILNVAYIALAFVIIYVIANKLELTASFRIYRQVLKYLPIFIMIVLAPELRKSLEGSWKTGDKNETLVSSTDKTKKDIADAAEFLSLRKIGALITIEKYNSLDQYAEKAVQMNSDVSKELLINIFTPLTPLHDGAVIIRGDKIRCAAAYYVLTETNTGDKTMGSRHRAAIGISEVSDSLTIVVSEETGGISITIEGIMLKVSDKEKLLEYIDMFMGK